MEPDKFPSHLFEALEHYHGALAAVEPPRIQRTIYRPHNGGIQSGAVSFPDYRSWEPAEAKEALRLPKIVAFFDYVWGRGEVRRTLTGTDPNRESWELFVLYDVLHESLCEEAVDVGGVSSWRFPVEFRRKLVDELVVRHRKGIQRFVARCPLAWVDGEPGDSWDLGHGMSLVRYDLRQQAIYLSRNHHRILWHDSISALLFDVAVLEIVGNIESDELRRGNPPKTGTDIIELFESSIVKPESRIAEQIERLVLRNAPIKRAPEVQ